MRRTLGTAILIAGLVVVSTAVAQNAPRESMKVSAEERAAKLAERERLWQETDQLYKDGKLAEALDRIVKETQLNQELFGEKSVEQAEAFQLTARIHEDREVWPEARIAARQALALREQLHGKDDWRTGDARRLVADVDRWAGFSPEQRSRLKQAKHDQAEVEKLTNNSKYREAIPLATRTLETFRDLLGGEHPLTAETMGWLAFEHHMTGDLAAADQLYREDVEARKKAVGEAHPDYAKTLCLRAMLRADMADNAGAEQLYREAAEIQKTTLGGSNSDYAMTLFRLGQLYSLKMGRDALAEPLWREALEIYEKPPANDLSCAGVASNLAGIYKRTGDFRRAESHYLRAIGIWKKTLGESHRHYATGLNNLATLYDEMADNARAEPLYLQALEIRKKALGESHHDYGLSLNNLGCFYQKKGAYDKAEPLFRQALIISKKSVGDAHPGYALGLNNLGELYNDMGDYSRAEPLHRQALEIRKKVLGEMHPDYATSLNNLAGVYKAMGDYARAEPLYRRALEIRKKVQGEMHSDYAASLNNLASLYRAMGDFAQAEPFYRQALEIKKKVRGEMHPDYALSLSHLGGLYDEMGHQDRAEPLYLQSLEIRKKIQGEMPLEYASSLNELARLYDARGDYAKAEPLYRQLLEIRKKVLGEMHPDYALGLNNLAELYREMGDYSRAEPLHRQALGVYRKVLGEKHPGYATSLSNLAALYDEIGDYAPAEPLLRQSLEITLEELQQTAGTTSERQQLLMVADCASSLASYLWLCLRAGRGGESVYPFWLEWKGQVVQRQRQLHALADQPELKPQFDELDRVTARLARLALATPSRDQAETVRRELSELSQKKERLQQELAGKSKEFLASLKVITLAELQAALPADSVLIDFADFDSRSVQAAKADPAKAGVESGIARPTTTWQRRLAAFVVKRAGPIKLVDLGGAKEVTAAIDAWRKDYGASPAGQKAGQLLRARVWQPLVGELADANLVLVSPDGTLGKLPFAALPGESPGSYLLERWPIAVIPTPASLPELAAAPTARSTSDKLLVVADVDYDHAANASPAAFDPKMQLAAADSPTPGTLTRGPARDATAAHWSSLSGTRGEGDTVARLYRQRFGSESVMSLVGPAASEETLRRDAPRCDVLHLATHGFFAPPRFRSALHSPDADGVGRTGGELLSNQSVTSFHPGVLSGLVLAGANQPPSEQGDGYLTAEEVMSLDLRGARLCVLSACETGLGQVAGGEGLLGLQRAFQAAGARTVVASLWQVPDEATRTLMERFYTNLWRSESPLPKLAALREAQLWMLREGGKPSARSARGLDLADDQPSSTEGRLPPYYWAAFVLSGDWR